MTDRANRLARPVVRFLLRLRLLLLKLDGLALHLLLRYWRVETPLAPSRMTARRAVIGASPCDASNWLDEGAGCGWTATTVAENVRMIAGHCQQTFQPVGKV